VGCRERGSGEKKKQKAVVGEYRDKEIK